MTSISKYSKSSKKLRTTFEAFKFPASDVVQFRALITPCLSSCKPVQCSLLNTETGINQEFVSYGKRKRRSHSLAPAAESSSTAGTTMHYEASGEEAAEPAPDVVVVGAIRIRENFASLQSPAAAAASAADAASEVAHVGGVGGGGDEAATAGRHSGWSSRDASDSAGGSKSGTRGMRVSSGSSGVRSNRSSDDCSNMIGLVIACVVFLAGQSGLLVAWVYMYRMSRVYRSKFLASAFPAAEAAAACKSSRASGTPHPSQQQQQQQQRHAAPPAYGVLSPAKAFPRAYSYPYAVATQAPSSFSSSSSSSSSSSGARSCTAASASDGGCTKKAPAPLALRLASGSPSADHVMSAQKVADYMSKRHFNHP